MLIAYNGIRVGWAGGIVATALALILVGCGGTNRTTDGQPTPSAEKPAIVSPPPADAQASAAKQTLKILTYNVLADKVAFDARTKALSKLIETADADIVCLQEASELFLTALNVQPWFHEKYKLAHAREDTGYANGNAIFFKTDAFKVQVLTHMDTRQGRQTVVGWTQIHGRNVAVATCHLDSYLEDGPIRAKELDDIFAALKDADDCILAGDLNFGDGESPDTEHLDKTYTDLWRALHPNDKGFTWNIEQSQMAKKGSFVGEPSRRIDRIFMKSKDGHWQPGSITIIGNEPLTPGDTTLFPSDHFGLTGAWESATPSK